MSFGSSGGSGSSIAASTDVALSSVSNGQVLEYNSSLGKWQNQAIAVTPRQGGSILIGNLYVGNNVSSPGYYIQAAGTLTDLYVYLGTAPTGSGVSVRFKIGATTIGTVSVAAGATTAHSSGLSVSVAADSIMTWDITAIGSTTPGADLGVAWTGVA